MKIVISILFLMISVAGISQSALSTSKYYINGDSVFIRNTGSKTHLNVFGVGRFTDTVSITTVDTSDNSVRAASTQFVHNLLSGFTGGIVPFIASISALRASNVYLSTTAINTLGYYA